MKKSALTILYACFCLLATAQVPTEGTTYFLPKTALRLSLLVEKTVFTPGQYANYAERYMKQEVKNRPYTQYRIIGISLSTYAIPDSSKQYTVTIDKKHSIIRVELDHNNVLKAVNAKAAEQAQPIPFKAARKPPVANVKDYLTEDMIAAGNSAKTAELIAQEIYDIRDSKNQLSRGEAEFMPKDGEQLRIMLNSLNTQETALRQVFEGTTVTDTLEQTISYIPTKEVQKELLFRFSRHLGMVDKDDLSGIPYYISITDEHLIPKLVGTTNNEKKSKEDIGLYVNMPGKIKVTLYREERIDKQFEVYAAQFGRVEGISGSLFGRKFTTHIILNPINGNVESMNTEPLE
ncbi:DUF4831 family protein [Hoylesella oralis]|uniref:DUF4831 family protein n=1 Tax=Hoylesella oralis TaxID=28134 RepID=UPI0028E45362|nr:DUF4831 family protein [Hoylesella oralis]